MSRDPATGLVRKVERRRELIDAEVACPAGHAVAEVAGGTAVRCQISRDTIDARHSPSALHNFCLGDHTQCPVWRMKRDAEIVGRGHSYQRTLDSEAQEVGELVV